MSELTTKLMSIDIIDRLRNGETMIVDDGYMRVMPITWKTLQLRHMEWYFWDKVKNNTWLCWENKRTEGGLYHRQFIRISKE